MFFFAYPKVLFALLLLPLFAWLKGKFGKGASVRFSDISVAKTVGKKRRISIGKILTTLKLLGIAILIIALARPRIGHSTVEVEASGIDIVLLIDSSTSMNALDFTIGGEPVDRLSIIKNVVKKFLKDRPNDRFGLVAFAGEAYSICPLTLDHNWLVKRLEDIYTGKIEDGTAIGSSIATGLNSIKKVKSKSRIMILLTDGDNNSGNISPEIAAELAKTLNVKIYTIGVGTRGEAPYPVRDFFGNTIIQRVKVNIDEDTLKKIANVTGGKYFRATDTESLNNIYDEINKLEKTKRKIHKFQNYTELFVYFLLFGLLLLSVDMWLALTKYRRLP